VDLDEGHVHENRVEPRHHVHCHPRN
jgi:hypothetical protein